MAGGAGNLGGVNPINTSTQGPANPNVGYNSQGQITPVDQLGGAGGAFSSGYSGQQFAPTPQTPPSGYRPTGTQQFYQPIYQQQSPNYNMGNSMSISQYGQQPYYGGGGYSGFMPQMQPQFNPYAGGFNSGYGGGVDSGYGGYMPQMQQMQNSYSQQQPAPQPVPQRTSSGPTTPIVSRSAQMRGTPNVMRRAEGGITSLLGDA